MGTRPDIAEPPRVFADAYTQFGNPRFRVDLFTWIQQHRGVLIALGLVRLYRRPILGCLVLILCFALLTALLHRHDHARSFPTGEPGQVLESDEKGTPQWLPAGSGVTFVTGVATGSLPVITSAITGSTWVTPSVGSVPNAAVCSPGAVCATSGNTFWRGDGTWTAPRSSTK